MKIIYTLTLSNGQRSYDIQVSSDQTPADTIKVLRENTSYLDALCIPIHMVNPDTGKEIDIEDTYEHQKIYSGAEIIIDA